MHLRMEFDSGVGLTCFCFIVVVDDNDDVVLSQKLSNKSLVKLGAVDEILLLLLLLLLLFMLLLSIQEIRSGTGEIWLALSLQWGWWVVGGLKSFSCQTQLLS